MKIPPSFEQAYNEILPTLEQLEGVVRPRVQEIAQKYNANYTGRIKSEESILIKAEKEGVEFPFSQINDLFACTIAVPNSLVIEQVCSDIEATFELVEIRQRSVKPEEFAYNDLNLSLKIKPDFYNSGKRYLDIIFELQIKTLLQHAWAQANHDVIYKARKRSWGLARIASQLRALLEMADSALANLEKTADILQGSIDYPQYEDMNRLATVLEKTWDSRRLPSDLLRAAQVIDKYLKLANLSIEDLTSLLDKDEYIKYTQANSLPPTHTIFIILYLEKWGDMRPRLKSQKLLITREMLDLCPSLARIPQNCRMQLDPILS